MTRLFITIATRWPSWDSQLSVIEKVLEAKDHADAEKIRNSILASYSDKPEYDVTITILD